MQGPAGLGEIRLATYTWAGPLTPNATTTMVAWCDEGWTAISGGAADFDIIQGNASSAGRGLISGFGPANGSLWRGWATTVTNIEASASLYDFRIYAICVRAQ